MTYCVAINTEQGLVFCSDSRTNAGFDNISIYSKMHTFVWPGERTFALLSAGNLATTQSVVKRLWSDIENAAKINLRNAPNMQTASDYIAGVSSEVQKQQTNRDNSSTNFEATFIFGGQIGTDKPETLLIYPQGNYIHESDEHPFMQIGEVKYGKPILDRVIKRSTPLTHAARCALVSMNSTTRSNLTVGPPIDLLIYKKDSLDFGQRMTLTENDPFAKELSEAWSLGLVQALDNLPRFPWE
ncbi:20S proteasome, A and B subunits [Ferriphaselus amnicola]|uniref:20S proteasome, A and B subunits n=1 Tax=Ferriphaselus amnicola TaxID=1188319 RepID=A0A2Z6GCV3_9PROT|nr:peptidase [Ferriphaselus amnicola]BBE50985.1 20S proteasome, A and B subunits [Ferriphaselus amnicola]